MSKKKAASSGGGRSPGGRRAGTVMQSEYITFRLPTQPPPPPMVPVSFRVPEELAMRIQQLLDPDISETRSDLLRTLLGWALDEVDRIGIRRE